MLSIKDFTQAVCANDSAMLLIGIKAYMNHLGVNWGVMKNFSVSINHITKTRSVAQVEYIFSDWPGSEKKVFKASVVAVESSRPRPNTSGLWSTRWDEYYTHNQGKIELLGNVRLDELERFIVESEIIFAQRSRTEVCCFATLEIGKTWYHLVALDLTLCDEINYIIALAERSIHACFNDTDTVAHLPGRLNLRRVKSANLEFVQKRGLVGFKEYHSN